MLRVGFDALPALEQMNRSPLRVVVELAPLAEGHPFRILNVGHHLGRFSRDQRPEFGGNGGDVPLDRVELREEAAIMEFELRQARIMKIARLLMKMARPSRVIGYESLRL